MAQAEPAPVRADVELLEQQLHGLKRERELLRTRGADREELEQNRRAIADAQREISMALIARHGPSFQPA